ncbi:unnamed protein product, partial [marine sediment metagenome]
FPSAGARDVAKALIKLGEEAGVDYLLHELIEPIKVLNKDWPIYIRFEATKALVEALKLAKPDIEKDDSADNGGSFDNGGKKEKKSSSPMADPARSSSPVRKEIYEKDRVAVGIRRISHNRVWEGLEALFLPEVLQKLTAIAADLDVLSVATEF